MKEGFDLAGYLFLFNDLESLINAAKTGLYGTILNPPYWRTHHEGTFADYVTMKPGDDVYFFHDRKIYGIGKLLQLKFDCKFLNFPGAGKPTVPEYNYIKGKLLVDNGPQSSKVRVFCIFEPSPFFFSDGVDMDDVLSSDPDAFRVLRVMWKRSFIKFEEVENQAFKNIILKRNQSYLLGSEKNASRIDFDQSYQFALKDKVVAGHNISNGIIDILCSVNTGSKVKHEMALELGVLHQLSVHDKETNKVFGEWDYISHQVVASPFKPVDYMDKMDIFGYSYIPNHRPSRSKYLIIEIKKDETSSQNVDQLMRYVDWVNAEYCHGDYSMIQAYLLSYSHDNDVIGRVKEVGVRKYTVGVRPTRSEQWSDVSLVTYRFNETEKRVNLNLEWTSRSINSPTKAL